MSRSTQSAESKPSELDANESPRPVRAAALISASAALGAALVVAVHIAGPKLPPTSGD